MRGTQLTPIVVLRELGRLFDVYKRPDHYPKDDDELARMFCGICADISAEQFAQAVTEYLKSPSLFMPKPGALRAMAQQQPGLGGNGADLGTFERWIQQGFREKLDGPLTPCPACGRAWQWQPRLVCVHDHARHGTLGLPCLGRCDDPTHSGPGLVAGEVHRESAGELWIPSSQAVG